MENSARVVDFSLGSHPLNMAVDLAIRFIGPLTFLAFIPDRCLATYLTRKKALEPVQLPMTRPRGRKKYFVAALNNKPYLQLSLYELRDFFVHSYVNILHFSNSALSTSSSALSLVQMRNFKCVLAVVDIGIKKNYSNPIRTFAMFTFT